MVGKIIILDYLLISDLFFIFLNLLYHSPEALFPHLELCLFRSYSLKRVILSTFFLSLFIRKDICPGGYHVFFTLTL
uniref:Uncharacterized protein n=1 Tax=Lepeophtheirus salmonis TaxID=72036 RepID=A0A0K2UCX4_LEPSM